MAGRAGIHRKIRWSDDVPQSIEDIISEQNPPPVKLEDATPAEVFARATKAVENLSREIKRLGENMDEAKLELDFWQNVMKGSK